MWKLMQIKGLQVYIEAENGGHLVGEASSLSSINLVKSSSLSSTADGSVGNSNVGLSSEVGTTDSESSGSGTGEKESNSSVIGSRGERIKDTLEREPIELQVEYVSYQHAGHAGNRGNEGEKHFNVKVVSKEFEGKSMVWRHWLTYNRSCRVDYTDCRLWQRLRLKLMVDESVVMTRKKRDELIKNSMYIATPGKGILAVDDSTGTIGKRLSSINVENIKSNP